MKNLTALFLFISLLISGALLRAADGYVEISPAQPTQTGDKIEVLEIFWYACPGCNDFQPHLETWLENKPDDVEFRRMPGIFGKSWVPHAKAYYTAEKLGVLDAIHGPLFAAIHRQGKKVHDDKAMRKFFISNGVDKGDFKKVYESDEVDTKVKQAFVMGQRYKVTGVPAVIVNGKYLVSGTTAGSFPNALKVIDQLIGRERANIAGR